MLPSRRHRQSRGGNWGSKAPKDGPALTALSSCEVPRSFVLTLGAIVITSVDGPVRRHAVKSPASRRKAAGNLGQAPGRLAHSYCICTNPQMSCRQADSRAKGVVGALSNVVQEQLQMKHPVICCPCNICRGYDVNSLIACPLGKEFQA